MLNRILENESLAGFRLDKAGGCFRALLILAAVLVVLWILAEAVWFIGIKATWSHVVDSIQDTLGVNTFLARALVTIGVIPLLWGVVDVFTFKSKRRKVSLSIIAVYVILFNVAMYAATRDQNIRFSDGKVMRYCAVTPNGVYCADKEGFDPSYGIKLEPMTPDRIRLVEAYERRISSGNFRPLEITRETPVFDPVSGEPVLYYMKLPTGQYRFFNGPGFDAVSGAALMPASPAIIQGYWNEIETAEQAKIDAASREQTRKTQEMEAQVQEQNRRAQLAQLEARRAELSGYFASVQTSADVLDVAVAISVLSGIEGDASRSLVDALGPGSADVKFHGTVFRPSFLTSRLSRAVFDGDLRVLQEAARLDVFPRVERVLIGMLGADCGPGYQNTIRCEINLEFRAYSLDGNLLKRLDFQEIGVGFERGAALAEGLENLAEKLHADPEILAGV